VRSAIAGVRGLALGALLLAGCELVGSVGGLSGAPGDDGDAAVDGDDVSTADVTSEPPPPDGAHPTDATQGSDSPVLTDSSGIDAPQPGSDATSDAGADASDAHADAPGTTDSTPPVDAPVEAPFDAPVEAPVDAPAEATVEAGTTYAGTVLADAPLAYWRVDEASGTVAHDMSGHGNDAQYVGGVTLGTGGALIGDADKAVTLDGATGHLDAGNRFNFTGAAAYTLECWAQPNNISTSYQRLFSRELQTTPREGYLLFVRSPNGADPSTFSIERWAANATNQCPETNAIAQVWHHFVATYDGSASRIYLDGNLVATQPAALALNATNASLWMGASIFDTAAYFAGIMDEVAVYGTALPGARIAAHFHASGR
jgi:hypothetical protein